MPEMPEVETVRRIMQQTVVGRTIKSVDVGREKAIGHPSIPDFKKGLEGRTVTGTDRRGKYIFFELDSGDRLCLHLRMTGNPVPVGSDEPVKKHTHVILHFTDGTDLRYIDVRGFGQFWLIRKDEDDSFTGAQNLGIEPLGGTLNGRFMKESMGSSRKRIKELLLDQSIIAGIGNIYADESLFRCGISPVRRACDVTDDEWVMLAQEIVKILSEAIEADAMTVEQYREFDGYRYSGDSILRIYGREKEGCSCCGSELIRTKVGGRGTRYCPMCQH